MRRLNPDNDSVAVFLAKFAERKRKGPMTEKDAMDLLEENFGENALDEIQKQEEE